MYTTRVRDEAPDQLGASRPCQGRCASAEAAQGARLEALASLESGHYEGTNGPDVIQAGDGPNMIWGKGADDLIGGGGGNDRLHGMLGNDRLFGQADEDELFGGPGNDFLSGGDDRVGDEFYGGAGTDTCVLKGPDNSAQNRTNCDIVVR